jgi:hypothetical protein
MGIIGKKGRKMFSPAPAGKMICDRSPGVETPGF